jgi:hypothetical protein
MIKKKKPQLEIEGMIDGQDLKPTAGIIVSGERLKVFPLSSGTTVGCLLVQSVIRRLPDSLYPMGRIHHKTHEYKWSLLKVRKGQYKGEHAGAQVESGDRARFSFSGTSTTYANLWEG